MFILNSDCYPFVRQSVQGRKDSGLTVLRLHVNWKPRKSVTEFEKQYAILTRGVAEIAPEEEFKERLKEAIEKKVPLRVKQGFDPTAPDIHLGHSVGIRKLKQFQDLGHKIVLIVGDYTALVGDPSGRSAARPRLTHEKILENAKTYQEQFFHILDVKKTEVHFNGSWFQKMGVKDLIELASKYTVARMLERDDFEKRYKSGVPISVHEFLYPLMQGYDSVEIKADIEIGATEQKFNLLVGRDIQPDYGVRQQVILTMPILVGLDGKMKMSKSSGNYVAIDDPENEMFGKLMSIPDDLIVSYGELASDLPAERLTEFRELLDAGSVNPMELKKELACAITDMYNGTGAGLRAREEFEKVFSRGGLPDEIEDYQCDEAPIWIVKLLTESGMTKSNGEARRMINAGAVSLDGERVSDSDAHIEITDPIILKVGKRRYRRLVKSSN